MVLKKINFVAWKTAGVLLSSVSEYHHLWIILAILISSGSLFVTRNVFFNKVIVIFNFALIMLSILVVSVVFTVMLVLFLFFWRGMVAAV